MRWLKSDMWKVGIVIASILLFLLLFIGIPMSTVSAQRSIGGAATPTEDATVTALNKEKLIQDVAQEQHTLGNWFWNNGAALVSSLVLAIAGVFTLFRYLRDQRSEREKQREDRQLNARRGQKKVFNQSSRA